MILTLNLDNLITLCEKCPLCNLTEQVFWTVELNPPNPNKTLCGMNSKNLSLGVFVMLTIVFASLTINEYNQAGILSAQLQSRTRTTQTVVTTQTSSSSTEQSTGPILSILGAEIARVIVSPWPGQMGVNPITGKVYISDLFNNTLTVLNASSRTILHTITLPGTAGGGIAIDTKNNLVYVPVSGCTNLPNAGNSCNLAGGAKLKGGIVRVDGRNDSIIGEIGIDMQGLAINTATLMLYGVSTDYRLSNNPTGYILGIDGHSGAIASNISVSASPSGIAVDPKTNMVYVSACGQLSLVCGNSEVLAINGTSNRVQWTAPLGFGAITFPIVVNPATRSVFVMGLTGANLTLDSFNGVTGKLIYSFALGSSCAGAGGGGLVIDAASNRLYAVSNGEDFFLTVDAATGQLVSTMTTPHSGGEYNIALDPATHAVFLTLEDLPHHNGRENGYFVVLSSAALNSVSRVDYTFLQRGVCLP